MIDAEPSPDDFGDAESICRSTIACRRANCDIWILLYGINQLLRPESERYVPKHQRVDYAALIANRPPPKSQFEAVGRIAYGVDPEEIIINMDSLWESAAEEGANDYIVVLTDLGPSGFKGEVTLTPCTAAEEQIRIGIARYAEPWEVLAASLTPEPEQAWASRLAVAAVLHKAPPDPCGAPAIREAATWPN